MLKTLLLVAALVLGLAESATAQIVSGTITGSVTDSSGAAIAGAKLILTSEDQGFTRETVSNAGGGYLFPTLRPGKYRLATTHPGFKTDNVSNIELRIDQTITLDLKMEVGQISEKVTIEASAAQLQTDTPAIGQVISGRPIVELPLNGRNFVQLANLSAAVVPATSTTSEAARLGRVGVTTHVAGSRASFSSYLFDGQESRGGRFGEIAILPSLDALQEFKIQRNSFSAEYGSSPGIISLTFKSGTNQFHGSVFEFIRNSALDAAQFFNLDGKAQPFKLNQFGFAFGGPIIHDRTFFFANYEGRRQRRATQAFATTPNSDFLKGNFASTTTVIRDPFNNYQPFAQNLIPSNRISSVARNFNQFINPSNGNYGAAGNLAASPSTIDDSDQVNFRVDHRFSGKDTMFVRYSKSDWGIATFGLHPFRGTSLPLNGHNAVIQETRILGPTAVNSLKLGFSRSFLASNLQPSERNLAAEVGFKNLLVLPEDYGLPRFAITGITQLGHSANTFRQWTNVYALSDTLAVVRGKHNLAFGADIRHNRYPQTTTNGSNGRFSFDGRQSGNGTSTSPNAVADYVMGAYATATGFASGTIGDFRFNQIAFFAQDDWKITRKLTLNLGLRYEYNQPFSEKGGSEGYFDPSIPGLRLSRDPSAYGTNIKYPYVVVDSNLRDGVVPKQFLTFAPRFGLAYAVDSKTVVRGGFGIFYAMNQGNDMIALSANPGASITTTYTNTVGRTPRSMDTLFDTPSASNLAGTVGFSVIDPERKVPYLMSYNFNIQRQLNSSTVLELGYIGSAGRQLVGRQELNEARLNRPGENLAIQARRPFTGFTNIWQFFGGEVSNYNGFTVNVEQRFRRGFQFLSNYTWSKSLDTYSSAIDDYSSPHAISNNRANDKALSSFDVRHRATGSVVWDMPFGKGRAYLNNLGGIGGWLVSGWQANGIIQVQTGLPLSVLWNSDRSQTGNVAVPGPRPNRIANGNLPSGERTPARWFDISAFPANPIGTYGNSGRNIIFGAGSRNIDFSLFKNNRLNERMNLQIRAEFFNAFDFTNFGRPGQFIDGANYGAVTATGPAREIQFAVKVTF